MIGLATATAEQVVIGPRTIEVATLRITDAGDGYSREETGEQEFA